MDFKRATAAVLCGLLFSFSSGRAYAEFTDSENRGWTYDRVLEGYYDDHPSLQSRRGELPIGTPSFDRRVNIPRVRASNPDAGLKLGLLRFHPAFSQIFELDDNIRLSRKDKKTDEIFRELPALAAEVQNSKFRMSGGYGMEIVNFVQDREENAVNHFAHGLLEYHFTDLTLSIEDTMEKSQSRP